MPRTLAEIKDPYKVEKKREQNRIAQRKYRDSQKQKIKSLEAAITYRPGSIEAPAHLSPLAELFNKADSPRNFEVTPETNDNQPSSSEQVWQSPRRSALHIAASNGHNTLVELLLLHGAGIDELDSLGNSSLHLAAECGHNLTAKLLIDKGADPNGINAIGRTPLFSAVQSGSEETVEVILQAKSNIETRDVFGSVALHLAAEVGQINIVKILLEWGAAVDA